MNTVIETSEFKQDIKKYLIDAKRAKFYMNAVVGPSLITLTLSMETVIREFYLLKNFRVVFILLFVLFCIKHIRPNLHNFLHKENKTEEEVELMLMFRKYLLNFKNYYVFIVSFSFCLIWSLFYPTLKMLETLS